jgi:aspartate dehydrogenase
MLRVSIIGFGAIGTEVLELLRRDADLQVDRVVVHAHSAERARVWLDGHGYAATEVAERLELSPQRPDLVVECAGHSAIEEHVLPALALGVPCLIASVGALSTPGLPERLEQAARAGGTQVQLLSGAIGAIDALAAARVGGLDHVSYCGRKPPRAWKGTAAEQSVDLDAVTAPTLIFQGSAREAAARYPKNANVAATLGLAGIGLDRTRVQLYADPQVSENVHEIAADGAFGSLALTLRGRPLATNPKTSALTVYSVVRALGNRAHAISI